MVIHRNTNIHFCFINLNLEIFEMSHDFHSSIFLVNLSVQFVYSIFSELANPFLLSFLFFTKQLETTSIESIRQLIERNFKTHSTIVLTKRICKFILILRIKGNDNLVYFCCSYFYVHVRASQKNPINSWGFPVSKRIKNELIIACHHVSHDQIQ